MGDSLSDFGRYSEAALLIMVSLADEPKHGYAIMADIEESCGGRVGPGTLYAALARLEGRGLIEALPAEERRRPYRLTPAGAVALRARLAELELVTATGLRRLAVSP